jgi:hypothetical protein
MASIFFILALNLPWTQNDAKPHAPASRASAVFAKTVLGQSTPYANPRPAGFGLVFKGLAYIAGSTPASPGKAC